MDFQKFIDQFIPDYGWIALWDYPLHIRRAFAYVGVYDDPYGHPETPEEFEELQKKVVMTVFGRMFRNLYSVGED